MDLLLLLLALVIGAAVGFWVARATGATTRQQPDADPRALTAAQEEASTARAEAGRAREELAAIRADAARQSLEALTAAVSPSPTAAPAPTAGGRTMEDVVLDALRPMLKDWLDTNLPSLVEAMVAKEISRITGKRL